MTDNVYQFPQRASLDPKRASSVDPERLTLALSRAGWRVVGPRVGSYTRFAPPPGLGASWDRRTVLVQLDREAPEFEQAMLAALADLADASGREFWSSALGMGLMADPADGFKFRKESAAPSGLIPWPQG